MRKLPVAIRLSVCALVLGLSAAHPDAFALSPERFSFVSLHPAGAVASRAVAVSGGQQVGDVVVSGEAAGLSAKAMIMVGGGVAIDPSSRAALWRGTAASRVLLEETLLSQAYSIFGNAQGGAVNDLAALWSGTAASGSFLLVDTAAQYTGGHVRGISNGWQAGEAGYAGGAAGHYRAALWHAASNPDAYPAILHFGGTDDNSIVWGIDGATAATPGQQAGAATVDGSLHAILWNGSAAAYVDLHPAGGVSSQAYALHGGRQAGYVDVGGDALRATVWQGTAASAIELHPAGMADSLAFALRDNWVAGDVYPTDDPNSRRALLWNLNDRGNPIDLSALMPVNYVYAAARGIDADPTGRLSIVGMAFNTQTSAVEAVMWTYDPPAAAGVPGLSTAAMAALIVLLMVLGGWSVRTPGRNGWR